MRYLIDGYNLMYAAGLLGKKLGPDQFRQVRTRFLNKIAAALGPIESALTTVVFDASQAPADVPKSLSHQGIVVLFAVDCESADERIEQLIARHSTPKSLTVVSSDRRIRTAATRRKARALSADAFLVELEGRRPRRASATMSPTRPDRDPEISPEEAAFWLEEFRELEGHLATREALDDPGAMLTDADIVRIEREIEREPE
jgi:predicted RNA-binding protein with PIN domain